ISGYLITGSILGALSQNKFSLRDFYSRRVRRLIPAAVAASSLTLALFTLFPMGLEPDEVALSAMFSAASLANIHFYALSGYFDTDSLTKPLLHMWSLGVEEQFYIVWPALLMLLFSRKTDSKWGRLAI